MTERSAETLEARVMIDDNWRNQRFIAEVVDLIWPKRTGTTYKSPQGIRAKESAYHLVRLEIAAGKFLKFKMSHISIRTIREKNNLQLNSEHCF